MAEIKKIKVASTIYDISPYEEYLNWGGKNRSGEVSPIGMALSNEHSANRMAFINGACIEMEYSSDGGSTYTSYGFSNSVKSQFWTSSYGIPVGRASSSTEYTTSSRTRITITAQNGTTGYVYTDPRKLLINISSSGGMNVLIEYRTGANYQSGGAWVTFGTYSLSGWSGWNDIPLILGTLGGGTTQTSNNWQLRLTFIMTSKHSSYPTTASINSARIYGSNGWTTPSNMARSNHLYSFDMSQNAFFPSNIYANNGSGTIYGNLSGNATSATSATKDSSGNTITSTYSKIGSSTSSDGSHSHTITKTTDTVHDYNMSYSNGTLTITSVSNKTFVSGINASTGSDGSHSHTQK